MKRTLRKKIFRLEGCASAAERGRMDGWCSSRFSQASPSCAGVKLRKASIPNVLPPSIRKEISSDGCVGGDVVQQRRGVEILMVQSLRCEGRALRAAANRKAQS